MNGNQSTQIAKEQQFRSWLFSMYCTGGRTAGVEDVFLTGGVVMVFVIELNLLTRDGV